MRVSGNNPNHYPDYYTSTYHTARAIAQLISVVGWFGVVGGVLLLLDAFFRGGELQLLVIPALGVALGGFFLAGTGQFVRAAVDTADYTGEMLAIMKATQPPSDRQAPGQ
jgi:hypothetical protein